MGIRKGQARIGVFRRAEKSKSPAKISAENSGSVFHRRRITGKIVEKKFFALEN